VGAFVAAGQRTVGGWFIAEGLVQTSNVGMATEVPRSENFSRGELKGLGVVAAQLSTKA